MIGVFDSGFGGLTVMQALVARFPRLAFVYLGDHANVPYGDRQSDEIVALTEAGVAHLFARGCRLVLLGCNTATAIAGRTLQREWLPQSRWKQGHNVLGIVAPTVEAATQTPWAVTEPQYPQKYNSDTIVVFGTTRTISSGVYVEEITKRCPRVAVVQVACPGLAGAIEDGADTGVIDGIVAEACRRAQAEAAPRGADHVILGCTHYPLVADAFERHLPARTRILSQPDIVADSLEDYLARHPHYVGNSAAGGVLLTTGDPDGVTEAAARFWPVGLKFQKAEALVA
ncbi:MAG: aspartate/glutamate racemase family protein [Hyphomicrobiaceae bacterium]|nr:aspartate/glutamate racemase family protein [Hyphomicrobiaceae bacterium]